MESFKYCFTVRVQRIYGWNMYGAVDVSKILYGKLSRDGKICKFYNRHQFHGRIIVTVLAL